MCIIELQLMFIMYFTYLGFSKLVLYICDICMSYTVITTALTLSYIYSSSAI